MLGVVACVLAVVCKRMQQLSSQRFLSPEVSLAASPLVAPAYGRRCVGLRPTPKIPAPREKNLWYPAYVFLFFPMFLYVFPYFPMFSLFPLFSSATPCFPMFPLFFWAFLFFFCFLMLLFVFPGSLPSYPASRGYFSHTSSYRENVASARRVLPSQLFYKILQHSVNFYMILRNIYYKFHTFLKLYIIS